MVYHEKHLQLLAMLLSALAGFVDALAFINLGGFFVSFMSGNSTRLGVGLVTDIATALTALGLIFCFVAGVIAGSFAGQGNRYRRRDSVLMLLSVLLFIAAILDGTGFSNAAIVFMALAMGAENGVFEKNGEVTIGVTYMTGTLVKFGQRVAAALLGGERFSWVPYLLLWMGLVVGATMGAAIYPYLKLQSLWIAWAAAVGLTMFNKRFEACRRDASTPTDQ